METAASNGALPHKRARLDDLSQEKEEEEGEAEGPRGQLSKSHPYGVQPQGNAYTACNAVKIARRRRDGLGALGVLDDELLLQVQYKAMGEKKRIGLHHSPSLSLSLPIPIPIPLKIKITDAMLSNRLIYTVYQTAAMLNREITLSFPPHPSQLFSQLPDVALARLAAASRACYVLVHDPSIWRERVLHLAAGPPAQSFTYGATWKDTYARVCRRRASKPTPPVHRPISDAGFFSDALFQPWAFGAMDLDPRWLRRETIPRAPPGLSLADFIAKYEEPNQPVILQDQVASWNAATAWTDDYLCSAAVRRLGALGLWDRVWMVQCRSPLTVYRYPLLQPAGVLFSAGQAQLTMADYLTYMLQADDERPLYIFDKLFVSKAPKLGEDYRCIHSRPSSFLRSARSPSSKPTNRLPVFFPQLVHRRPVCHSTLTSPATCLPS